MITIKMEQLKEFFNESQIALLTEDLKREHNIFLSRFQSLPPEGEIELLLVYQEFGLEVTSYLCTLAPQYNKQYRNFAVWCAEKIIEERDYKSFKDVLSVAKDYIKGNVGDKELNDANREIITCASCLLPVGSYYTTKTTVLFVCSDLEVTKHFAILCQKMLLFFNDRPFDVFHNFDSSKGDIQFLIDKNNLKKEMEEKFINMLSGTDGD